MEDRAMQRPVVLAGAAVTVGVSATLCVTFIPDLRFAYRSDEAHLVLETVDAAVAGLVALLFFGRFRRSRAVSDLLLSYAMTLLVVADLGFATVPLLAGADRTSTVTTWAPIAIRLLGAGLFLAAAATPAGRTATRRPSRDIVVLLTVSGAVLLVSLLAPHILPEAIDPDLAPEDSSSPRVGGHPVVAALQLSSFVCYALACVLFTRRARETGDDFLTWVGAAAGVSAIARVNYALFPSVLSEYVYTGDFLRLASYLLLLVGGVREINQYSARIAEAAVLEERQRLARDLHDGVSQELTFIWSQLQQLERRPDDGELRETIKGASARAIDEARRAIAALTRPVDEPIGQSLTQAAEEVATRYGSRVDVEIDEVLVDPAAREALIRIVREAVGNAARHAGGGLVSVRLKDEVPGMRLEISDEGAGFDLSATKQRGTGYGLTTMRQRARESGGRFDIRSRPGLGTVVTVVWDE
jgi:signal transduction histidine kinase